MISLQKRLLYLRELNDLSQAAVSRKLHMSSTGYFEYESGRSNPPLETLIKLADLFHVSVDYLLGHEPEDKELDNMIKDLQSLSPDRRQKLAEIIRLYKLDMAYEHEQRRRAEHKQQRLSGAPAKEPLLK